MTHSLSYPDEDLKSLQLPLRTFVALSQALFPDSGETQVREAFIRFVLSGRLCSDGTCFRTSINAKQGMHPPAKYQLFRDIDSVIGVTQDLPFRRPFAIFPLPVFRETLTKNNHMTYQLQGGYEGAFGVSLHKIPNMALGKADRRHVTRIFFPRLYIKNGLRTIKPETMKLIYEDCLRPAAIFANPVDQSRWPIDRSALMTLYRDVKGTFHHGSIDFPSQHVSKFGIKLLELFGRHDNLKDAFFLHELRGTKSSSHHDPRSATGRKAALKNVLDIFDMESLDPNQWVIDVGLEIREEGCILQWLTEGHHRILQYLLPSLSEELIAKILISPTQYSCDISAQLSELGGFRASPGSRGKKDKVEYANVYTTDKSATYQLHNGIYRRRRPYHLFPSYIAQLTKDMKRIGEIFLSCAREQEGNARMEVRVPLTIVDLVLVDMPRNLLEAAVVSFPCETLWQYYRLSALLYLVESFQNDDTATRLLNESLTLGAIITYQFNAIIYRPGDDLPERTLLNAACQHIIDANGPRPSLYDRGCYFLSDIVKKNGSYHLPPIRLIDSEVMQALYRRLSFEEILAEFHLPAKRKSSSGLAAPLQKRQKITTRVSGTRNTGNTGWSGDEVHYATDGGSGTGWSESEVYATDGGSNTRLHGCKDQDFDPADDIDNRQETGGEYMQMTVTHHPCPPRVTLSDKQTQDLLAIFQQFPADIFELIPKSRTKDSMPWILPSVTREQLTSTKLFKTFEFKTIFRQAQYKVVGDNEWGGQIFDRYFPPKEMLFTAGLQTFPTARYYQRWAALSNECEGTPLQKIRMAVLQWFQKFFWLPLPVCDRMWSTKLETGGKWIRVPPGEPQSCPKLAVNPLYWDAHKAGDDAEMEARESISQALVSLNE